MAQRNLLLFWILLVHGTLPAQARTACQALDLLAAPYGATLSHALSRVVPYANAVVRAQRSAGTSNSGALSSRHSVGLCGLSSAVLQEALEKFGVRAIAHQSFQVFGSNAANHVFLIVPLLRGVDGRPVLDTQRALYLDLTFRQFNGKSGIEDLVRIAEKFSHEPGVSTQMIRRAQELNTQNQNLRYQNSPLAQLARTEPAFLSRVLRDGYALMDNQVLRHLGAAMSVDSDGRARRYNVPRVIDLLEESSFPDLTGADEIAAEYSRQRLAHIRSRTPLSLER